MIRAAASSVPRRMAHQFANKQPQGFRNHVENIAIVGAGGSIGQHITQALLSHGKHKVTAITREDSSNKLPSGLHHIKKVNYDDRNSLINAMKGQDALIITMKPMAPPDSQIKIIDAAVEAGVEYIMPNEYGIDVNNKSLAEETMVGAKVLEAREYIEKVGKGKTHWLGLVCGFWYEFSLAGKEGRYGFDFDEKSLTWFDDGGTKVTMSTWPQVSHTTHTPLPNRTDTDNGYKCGRAVASLFSLPKLPKTSTSSTTPTLSSFANSPVYVSSFNVSQRDMLASVLHITGNKESDWSFTSQNIKERYEKAGEMRKQGIVTGYIQTLYTRVFFPNGGGCFQSKVVNEQLGLPKEDLDEATRVAIEMHEGGYFDERAT